MLVYIWRRRLPSVTHQTSISCRCFEDIFFRSRLSFTIIHDSQDSRGGGGYLFNFTLHSSTSTGYTGTHISILHTAHLCTYVTARPELGTFALRAQVVNHWPARPFEHISILPSLNALRITSWMVKLQVTSKKCNCDFAKVCIQQKSKTNLRIYWITMIRVEIHEMNFWRN